MLPFLKPKKITSVMVATRHPDGRMEHGGYADDEHPGLMACAEDLIHAVHAKDAKAVAEALKAACEICDEMEENESPESEQEQE